MTYNVSINNAENSIQRFLRCIDMVQPKDRFQLFYDSESSLYYLREFLQSGDYAEKDYRLFESAHNAGVKVYELTQEIESIKADFNC